ncbi:MAG: ester cyclase [Dehalococcoidia bacterium]|nr:ester cyclase [Dehalococcoidia bacterium]
MTVEQARTNSDAVERNAPMTTKSENGIRLVQECVAGENAQDYDRMYSVFGETATYYLNGEILGSAPTADFRDLEKQTTPGIYGNSHREIQWIDGNDTRVVYQYKIQFNHNGEVFGFPPTGRRVEFHGVSIAEHDGNEIRLIRLFADQGEMNRQLSGKLRTPGTVSAAPQGPTYPRERAGALRGHRCAPDPRRLRGRERARHREAARLLRRPVARPLRGAGEHHVHVGSSEDPACLVGEPAGSAPGDRRGAGVWQPGDPSLAHDRRADGRQAGRSTRLLGHRTRRRTDREVLGVLPGPRAGAPCRAGTGIRRNHVSIDNPNVEAVKRAVGHVNRREFEQLMSMFVPGGVRHDLAGAYPDLAGEGEVRDFLGQLLQGSPDFQIHLEDAFGSGDRVCTRIRVEGTHAGRLFGQEGTGRPFSVNQLNVYRFADGKMAESWQLTDLAGFMSQVGG